MTRLCALCYGQTYGSHAFCYSCYKQYEEEIKSAIENDAPWLRELLRLTQVEFRRLEKETLTLRLIDGD